MIIFQNKQRIPKFLQNKIVNLLFFVISLIILTFISLLLFFDFGLQYTIKSSISYTTYQTIIIAIIIVAILLLTSCFLFTKAKILKIISGILLGIVTIIIFIFVFLIRPHRIIGGSMSPNIADGDYIISSLIAYRFNS